MARKREDFLLGTTRKALFSAGLFLHNLVGERGFEPPTHWSQTSCATKLRYSPNIFLIHLSLFYGAKGGT